MRSGLLTLQSLKYSSVFFALWLEAHLVRPGKFTSRLSYKNSRYLWLFKLAPIYYKPTDLNSFGRGEGVFHSLHRIFFSLNPSPVGFLAWCADKKLLETGFIRENKVSPFILSPMFMPLRWFQVASLFHFCSQAWFSDWFAGS